MAVGRREVGDRLVEHPAADRSHQVSDQPGADDGAVGLVQVFAELADLGVLAVAPSAVSSDGPGSLDDERGPTDAGTRERAEPQPHLDAPRGRPTPTGPPPPRECRPRSMPGPSLMPVGKRWRETEREIERRRPVRRVAEPPRGVAAGRIEVDAVDARRGRTRSTSSFSMRAFDQGARLNEAMAAVTSSRSTPVTSISSAAMASASAPMPQPRSATHCDARALEPPGVLGRNLKAGRLLEAGLGEQHPVGERTELGRGLRAQSGLAEHRGDEAGTVARFAQLRRPTAPRHPSTSTPGASRAGAGPRARAVRISSRVSIALILRTMASTRIWHSD